MANTIKETLLSTCLNGKEVLNNLKVLKEVSNEKLVHKNHADDIVSKYISQFYI